MKARRVLLALGCGLAGVALLDLGLTWLCLGDGKLFGRPVPPYGDVREERWRAWAVHRRAALAAEQGIPQSLAFDAELGWTNAPSFRSPDGTQQFDSRGLRGTREYATDPPEGVLRVALFGESFVYGEEVPDGDDFCAQLEALDPAVEAMNYGVSGYGTDQALMRFRREGRSARAHVLCIGLMLENIVRNVSRFTRLRNPYLKGVGIKPRFRLEHDRLVLVPNPFASEAAICDAVLAGTLPEDVRAWDAFAELPYDSWAWKSSLARLAIGWRGSVARDYRRAWSDESGEPFELLLAILAAFDAEARAAGAQRTLVLVFPPKEDLALALSGERRFWSGLAEALAARHVESLDFTDALSVKARELGPEGGSPTEVANRVFLRAHLNRTGNEVVARALLARLRGH